jgi:glutathione-regulated potassium-efflux system ancillary protein KefC
MFAEIASLLVAGSLCVMLARALGLSSVLGYLAAGVLVGPVGLGLIDEVDFVLHLAEIGVVLLLFLIGLELQPRRLWALRRLIFGLGASQVLLTGACITSVLLFLDLPVPAAVAIGFALALSSTALVLQMLSERGELTSRLGRTGFAILLFQDLAVIPLLALLPLLGDGAESQEHPLVTGGVTLLGIAVLLVAGRFALSRLLAIAARMGTPELFTAVALLVVLLSGLWMEFMGASMALGAFLAGVLLADSTHRHVLVAEVSPFKGLLLGLFFMAVGMGLEPALVLARPGVVLGVVGALVAGKALLVFGLVRYWGLPTVAATRLALLLSQGGEFAFVLFSLAGDLGVVPPDVRAVLEVAVTLSMVTTPLLLLILDAISPPRTTRAPRPAHAPPDDETPEPDGEHPVIIIGFGRLGQIVGRALALQGIEFTGLDRDFDRVEFVKKYGNRIYYGDPSRLEVLRAAHADKARAIVLTVDDVERSVAIAELIRRTFPDVRLIARAHNRDHAHALVEAGVEHVYRETYFTALEMARSVFDGLGFSHDDAESAIRAFRELDENDLRETHPQWRAQRQAREREAWVRELEALFEKGSRTR